jgi:DNA-binding transcriptional LysR family regulator
VDRVDLRALRYAVTLAEELHFGRAARRHYISAQPFGQVVGRLERELGYRLFERTSRRVTPTEAGERFVARVRTILAGSTASPTSVTWPTSPPRRPVSGQRGAWVVR